MAKFFGFLILFFISLAIISGLNHYSSNEEREELYIEEASKHIMLQSTLTDDPILVYLCKNNDDKFYYSYNITNNEVEHEDAGHKSKILALMDKYVKRNTSLLDSLIDWRPDDIDMEFIVAFSGGSTAGFTALKAVNYYSKHKNVSGAQNVLAGVLGGISGWFAGKYAAKWLMTPRCDSKVLLEFLAPKEDEGKTLNRWRRLENVVWDGLTIKINENISNSPGEDKEKIEDKFRKFLNKYPKNYDFKGTDFFSLLSIFPIQKVTTEKSWNDPADELSRNQGTLDET